MIKAPLTEEEENLLKDIIKYLSKNPELENRIRASVKLNKDIWNIHMDSIFVKLQNGRVTFITK